MKESLDGLICSGEMFLLSTRAKPMVQSMQLAVAIVLTDIPKCSVMTADIDDRRL